MNNLLEIMKALNRAVAEVLNKQNNIPPFWSYLKILHNFLRAHHRRGVVGRAPFMTSPLWLLHNILFQTKTEESWIHVDLHTELSNENKWHSKADEISMENIYVYVQKYQLCTLFVSCKNTFLIEMENHFHFNEASRNHIFLSFEFPRNLHSTNGFEEGSISITRVSCCFIEYMFNVIKKVLPTRVIGLQSINNWCTLIWLAE